MNHQKYVIKISYPQRSETIVLYYKEPGSESSMKKTAMKFDSKEEAVKYVEQIEKQRGSKFENWVVEKA